MFGQLKFAINQTFDVEKDKRNLLVQTSLQLFMLVVLGGLLIVGFTISILASLVFSAKVSLFGISPSNFSFMLPILSYLIPFLLEAAVFAIMYKISPARQGMRWKPVIISGLIAALLFEILKVFMGIYVNVFGAATSAQKTYGAIGGIFVFLFFLYCTGVVILLGAELAATLHNFKSSYAGKEVRQAVVEDDDAKYINGEYVPAEVAQQLQKQTKTATIPAFDYGVVEEDPAVVAARTQEAATKKANSAKQPIKSNPLTLLVGGLTLLVATVISLLTRPRTKIKS
jgi:uncharacterized BrkB/YihY/UPF0761 family membrane protein